MRVLTFHIGVNTRKRRQAKLRQRAGILLAAFVVISASFIPLAPVTEAAPGEYSWQKAGPNLIGDRTTWNSIASSADGTKLVASGRGSLYTSVDSGATWTEHASVGPVSHRSVASSADGTKMVAVAQIEAGNIYTSNDSGATWTEQTAAGSRSWRSVASSADGTKLVAVVAGYSTTGAIYTSVDSGVTWVEQTAAGLRKWWDVASSADGSKLSAVVDGGYVYTSVDSGATWVQRTTAGLRDWKTVASSADGNKLVAANLNNSIYTSVDSGVTWVQRVSAGAHPWWDVVSSTDGTRLTATPINGPYFYTSADSGATWTEQTSLGSRYWITVASSADGTNLVAAAQRGSIYISVDSGSTWTEQTVVGSRNWQSVASSTDNTKLVAIEGGYSDNGYIYISVDSGASWTENTAAGLRDWQSVASSADGTKLLAGTYAGSLYLSTDSGTTWTPVTSLNSSGNWSSVAMTPSGTTMVASDGDGLDGNGGYVYVSTDSGATWQQQTTLGLRDWGGYSDKTIAISADSQTIAIADGYGSDWNDWNGGYIYITRDGGATWQAQTSPGAQGWSFVALSANGEKLVAGVWGGSIYTSVDFGITWVERTSAGLRNWSNGALSANGEKLVAGVWGGSIYTSADLGASWVVQSALRTQMWTSVAMSFDGSNIMFAVRDGNIYLATLEPPATTTFNLATLSGGSQAATIPAITGAQLSATSETCYTLTTPSIATLTHTGISVPEANVTILGGIGFSLSCASSGGSADTAITLGTSYSDLSSLRVYKSTGSGASTVLTDITDQVTITNETIGPDTKTVIRYTLTDGEVWDEDGVADGTIVDPIYFGVVAGASTATPATPVTTVASDSLASTGANIWTVAVGGVLLALVGIFVALRLAKSHSSMQLTKR